jgi:uncharacterized protein YggE
VTLAPASAQAADQRTITVTGIKTVETPNDAATVNFRVRATRNTKARALSAMAAGNRRVTAALAAQGVAREDIQSQDVSLRRSVQPRTKRHRRRVFYTAANTLSATLHDVTNVDRVVQAAVRAGAIGVDGIEFFVSNTDALYRQALGSAYDDAREKAQLLAQRAGVTLGQPISIQEGQDFFSSGFSDLSSSPSAGSIEPGTGTVIAFVTVVFAIS